MDDNDKVISPNGKFTVSVKNRPGYFIIKNNETGIINDEIESLPQVYSITWTGNSKAFIAFSPIAGGSTANIISYSKGNWIAFNGEPPFNDIKFSAIKIIPEYNNVKLIYRCAGCTEYGTYSDFFICSFDVNPENGIKYNTKKTIVSKKTWMSYKPLDLQ